MFAHLHCHTEYSLLDGAIRLKDLIAKTKEYKMPAAAITDHGNMHGAAYFYMQAKDAEITPILGCEIYTCHDHTDKTSDLARFRHHLILLAQDNIGYKNLLKIVTKGALEGKHYKPRVDKKILLDHNEGIIALSACIAGEIPQNLLGKNKFLKDGGGFEEAIKSAEEYKKIFPDRFYLEVQSNTLPDQQKVNELMYELAEKTSLPLVATNDCHYLSAEDVEAHDTLLCIQTGAKVTDAKRMSFDATDLYYKSPQEMAAAFKDHPEAISNTLEIAERCSHVELDLKSNFFPVYELPEGMTLETEFRKLATEGLKARIDQHPEPETIDIAVYEARLKEELDVICDMGFPGYFLIVQDFINWAKDNGIPVGPGRGSAAGSIVAWALRITNLDPIPYNLLFERFLNKERVSMPDIDVDFCEDRRTEVIRYVMEKYGEDKVAQITTFGKMKAKAVVKDVGRALDVPYKETDFISKLIPTEDKMTVKKAIELVPEIKELYMNDARITKMLDISMRLEGLSRHASTHAAGLVVSDKPMVEYLPLYKGKRDETVTQFDMKMVEKVGLVKFDFLGLRTMTLIVESLKNIEKQGKIAPNLDTLLLNDPQVYDLFARGDTDGIFQVESSGMRQYLRQLKPNCFEDIIAMLALYRPGPLNSGMVDEFIKRKHGELEVTYPLPQLEECLRDTYGVIVYQEQVMQIAQIVANYSLGGADLLRRAMGKKDPQAMANERSKFLAGAVKNNVNEQTANEIFDLMEKFAEYGFNKSHSAAYALISYHTAYLKHYHPVEFMAALLSSEIGNQDKILKYITTCHDMGIEVLQPSVQISEADFVAHENAIIYGFGGIKGVGNTAINEIVSVRGNKLDGTYEEFSSFLSFLERVSLRKVSRKVTEALIKSGACDSFGVSRRAITACLEPATYKAQRKAREQASNQISLFAELPIEEKPVLRGLGFDSADADLPEWDDDVLLNFEKEVLGFFLSSHPLRLFHSNFQRLQLTELDTASEYSHETEVRVPILITESKVILTKKGKNMAFLKADDLTGHAEVIVFPNTYDEYKHFFLLDKPLVLTATIDNKEEQEAQEKARENALLNPHDDEDSAQEERSAKIVHAEGDEEEVQTSVKEVKLIAQKFEILEDVCKNSEQPLVLTLPEECLTSHKIQELKAIFDKYQGETQVFFKFKMKNVNCQMQAEKPSSILAVPQFFKAFSTWKYGNDKNSKAQGE